MPQASNQSPSSQRPLYVLRRNQDPQSPASILVVIITTKEEQAWQAGLHLQDDGLPATAQDTATCLTVLSSQPASCRASCCSRRADGPGTLDHTLLGNWTTQYWEMGAQYWEMGAQYWEMGAHSTGKWERRVLGNGSTQYWEMGVQSTGKWEQSTGKWEHSTGKWEHTYWEMEHSTEKWEHSTGKWDTVLGNGSTQYWEMGVYTVLGNGSTVLGNRSTQY
ncbi:uncharacterized protein LOC115896515 [Rhinopithecus roxellana]|uniref:uncharacterized protein LOC115894240 n=1 Tax=Rhinopithecus roxellana TaxID=61622 RepID=UPI0012372FA0|nr:uncharacterized protein LOC115894240 [Rhinopithecus roxellana]XP_030782306.1 uncharacterized protein LOC115895889 [Rhinopithecus roxellana]XP_030783481.1 uncharacterized protein LOC115896504 [Rhinopithecus roxellana]XP_030783549.1 uncharacterized protein LOC115896515 [Rhinopithecus roxellana]